MYIDKKVKIFLKSRLFTRTHMFDQNLILQQTVTAYYNFSFLKLFFFYLHVLVSFYLFWVTLMVFIE